MNSEEVVRDSLPEGLPQLGDLLVVRGDGLPDEGDDHVTTPVGFCCFSEIVDVRGAQVRAWCWQCLGLACFFLPLFLQDVSQLPNCFIILTKLGNKMCSLYVSADLTSHLTFFLNGFSLVRRFSFGHHLCQSQVEEVSSAQGLSVSGGLVWKLMVIPRSSLQLYQDWSLVPQVHAGQDEV